MQIQNAHSRFELLLPFALCLALTFPPSTSLTPPSCTSYPGHFLPPVWGTSNIVVFGGQDVSLIITQSDLHPAPDSLPLAPDTSFACGGLERRGGVNVWTCTHREELQQGDASDPPADRHNAVVHELAHSALAVSRLLASSSSAWFHTSALAESQLLPATGCMCVFAFSGVCARTFVYVCALEWWCSRQSCSPGSKVPLLSSLLGKATSAFCQYLTSKVRLD